MHSFHHSRGRVFFETLCALTVSASCAGAWVQTGASALLPAAAAAALYGLWHLTDMRRPNPAFAAEVAHREEEQGDLLAYVSNPAPEQEVEPLQVEVIDEVAAPKAKRPKRKKAAPRQATELSAVQTEPEEPVIEVVEPTDLEEHHAPIVPLFEAKPVVQQPRAVFGRKAG